MIDPNTVGPGLAHLGDQVSQFITDPKFLFVPSAGGVGWVLWKCRGSVHIPLPTPIRGSGRTIGKKPLALTGPLARHGGSPVRLPHMRPGKGSHVHMVGEIGAGKSTLIVKMILDDIRAGCGVVVIDPTKGDIIRDVLDRLPSLVTGDKEEGVPDFQNLCVIDAADPDWAVGINPLEVIAQGEQISSDEAVDRAELAVSNLLALFQRLYSTAWGHVLEYNLRQVLLTLIPVPGATLIEVPLLFNSGKFRNHAKECVKSFYPRSQAAGLLRWWSDFEALKPDKQRAVIGPLVYKFDSFLRGKVRSMFGQAHPKGDPFELVKHRGIVLVSCPKGIVGEDAARLIGAICLLQTWQKTTSQTHIPESQRPPTKVYLDEVPNFIEGPAQSRILAKMMDEGRGWNDELIISHQRIGQLDEIIKDALDTNAKNRIWFKVSKKDGKDAKEVLGQDPSELRTFQAIVKTPGRTGQKKAVLIRTLPPSKPLGTRQAAMEASNARWAARRKESFKGAEDGVDDEIFLRHEQWLSDKGTYESDPQIEVEEEEPEEDFGEALNRALEGFGEEIPEVAS